MLKKSMITTFAVVFLSFACARNASAYTFGDTWTFDRCPKCGKYYKHTGVDYMAKAGKKVYLNKGGKILKVHKDSNGWKWCVVVQSGSSTFVVWHLDNVLVQEGKTYYGPMIPVGYVADLQGKSANHVHVGQRNAPYDSTVSMAGALPACDHKPGGYPQFPAGFVFPESYVITIP